MEKYKMEKVNLTNVARELRIYPIYNYELGMFTDSHYIRGDKNVETRYVEADCKLTLAYSTICAKLTFEYSLVGGEFASLNKITIPQAMVDTMKNVGMEIFYNVKQYEEEFQEHFEMCMVERNNVEKDESEKIYEISQMLPLYNDMIKKGYGDILVEIETKEDFVLRRKSSRWNKPTNPRMLASHTTLTEVLTVEIVNNKFEISGDEWKPYHSLKYGKNVAKKIGDRFDINAKRLVWSEKRKIQTDALEDLNELFVIDNNLELHDDHGTKYLVGETCGIDGYDQAKIQFDTIANKKNDDGVVESLSDMVTLKKVSGKIHVNQLKDIMAILNNEDGYYDVPQNEKLMEDETK